jgi:hypothetical protein
MSIISGLITAALCISVSTQAITRAEFSALAVAVYESAKGEIMGRGVFSDTDDEAVGKAAFVGIVNGMGDGKFNPDGTFTREMAAVVLSNLANALGQPLALCEVEFSDIDEAASWSVKSIGRVLAAGIMSGIGEGRFAPREIFTREESILTLTRLHNNLHMIRSVEYTRLQWGSGRYANGSYPIAEVSEDSYTVSVFIEENSGSNRHEVVGVRSNGDILIRRIVPEIGTHDMALWQITVELDVNFRPDQFRIVFV